MVTVTLSVDIQPLLSETVRWYVVVVIGEASTVCPLVVFKPVAGDQLYIAPGMVAAFKVAVSPRQIAVSFPASTIGTGNTTILTVSDATQLFASVPVTVYKVVLTGDAIGLAVAGSDNPAMGDQL